MRYQELFPVPTEWVQDVDEAMAETVARWAEQEVMAKRLEYREDYEKLLLPAMSKLFLDIGLQAMLWPEEAGGGGLSSPSAAMTVTAMLEQAGRADTGIAFLLANTFALQSTFGIEPHRNEALLGELTPLFSEGREVSVGALVLPAYGNGSGGERPSFSGLDYQVTAWRKDGRWVLKGEQVRPQCSGATAGIFGVVFALDDGTPAIGLVPSGVTGLSAGETFKKTGLAASVNADLVFKDVESYVVMTGPDGVKEMLCWYYMGCSAACVGALFASHEILKEWGETRVIKGKGHIFKDNPLVAALMGQIGSRIAINRILTYNLARMLSKPDLYGPAGSQAIYATATAIFQQVSRSAMQSIDNSMELMASAGYATEWNLERYWRDVKTIETYVIPETVAQTGMAEHYFGSQIV